MERAGSPASPAVMPIVSMPPNAKTTTDSAASRPPTPLGMKPPWSTRFCGPTVSPGAKETPMTMSTMPPTIIAMMAPTLMMVSQNSSSPKIFTLRVLIAAMNRITAATQIQRGVSGNQKPM